MGKTFQRHTIKSIKDLKRGDIVRNLSSRNTYVIDAIFGNYAIGVRIIHISNPDEWIKIKKL